MQNKPFKLANARPAFSRTLANRNDSDAIARGGAALLNGASIFHPPVVNSGTSEGAKNGWITRHGGSPNAKDGRKLMDSISTRKSDGENIASADFDTLSEDRKNHIKSLPSFKNENKNFDDNHPHLKEGSDNGSIEHVMEHGGKQYYVNTEGYGYPRYATHIKGFKK